VWWLVPFFVGVGLTTLYALFISGMALYDDWL
jgi:hypothetical protein